VLSTADVCETDAIALETGWRFHWLDETRAQDQKFIE
jgi:hypothetical protein